MNLEMHPLGDLSVLVTCYNKSDSVEGFLIQAQELTKLGCELIVVDDGSRDGSAQKLRDGLQSLENSRLIEQSNQGSAAARNSALDNATRKFLQFLDIDDFLNIELLTDIFRSEFLSPDALSIFELSRVTKPEFPPHPEILLSKKLSNREVQELLVSNLGYSRIIYPRQIVVDYKLKFAPTFASLGGERFILDDFFWIVHIGSLNIKCIKFDDTVVTYGYVKPENNASESGKDFANQASLFPKASVIFFQTISQCRHKHDSDFMNQSIKSSNIFHFKFVPMEKMHEVIKYLFKPNVRLSNGQT